MGDEIFAAMRQSVIDGDAVAAAALAEKALADGVPPLDAIEIGFVPGLSYVGDDAGGAYDPATGAWTLGTLGTGTTATLHVVVTVTAPWAKTGVTVAVTY